MEQLRGTWRQIDVDPVAGADFAPGGAPVRVIGIDPQQRRMLIVCAWGTSASLVLAGEVEAGFRSTGRVSTRVRDDYEGGRYPALPAVLPGGMGTYVRPNEEALELRWSLEEGVLTIGDRRYEPCEPSALQELLHRTPAAGTPVLAEPSESGTVVVTTSEGSTAASSTDFFGLKATGRWFCYIVDISGSMGKTGRLQQLLRELDRSISSLPPDANFYVLFFSGSTRTLQNDWLAVSKKKTFIDRMYKVNAGGGTDPRKALNIALNQLKPRPDAVFFMTDGEIPGDCVGLVAILNAASPRVRIHTVSFGGGGAAALQAIARANGGQYRMVP